MNYIAYHVGYIPDTYKKGGAKFKIKASFPTKKAAEEGRTQLIAKATKYGIDVGYDILTTTEVQTQWDSCKNKAKEQRIASLKKTNETRKAHGIPKSFILCPRCNAKSKKLYSEMGGLQTRKCANGHMFAYDTFAGANRYAQTYDQFTRNTKPGY
jgi:hypothetical protein